MLQAPLNYVKDAATALQWPIVVIAAYYLGCVTTNLKSRLTKAETNLAELLNKHMPALHKVASDIQAKLDSIYSLLMARK